jgi:hypothetical protein
MPEKTLREAGERMAAAITSMPDAGLTIDDPRYEWWLSVAIPARAAWRVASEAVELNFSSSAETPEVAALKARHAELIDEANISLMRAAEASSWFTALRDAVAAWLKFDNEVEPPDPEDAGYGALLRYEEAKLAITERVAAALAGGAADESGSQ